MRSSSSSSMKKRTVGWRCIHIGSQVGESISIRERVLKLMKLTALRLHVAKWVLLITANYLLSKLTSSVLPRSRYLNEGIIDLRNDFFYPFKGGGAAECSNLPTGLNQPAELWRTANLHTHQSPAVNNSKQSGHYSYLLYSWFLHTFAVKFQPRRSNAKGYATAQVHFKVQRRRCVTRPVSSSSSTLCRNRMWTYSRKEKGVAKRCS